jgi:hypothetical protein
MNLLLSLALIGQQPPDEPIWVGIERTILVTVKATTLAPRSPAGATAKAMPPLVLSAVNPVSVDAGTGARVYEVRYIGLKAGDHDLRDYLQFPDDVSRQMVPPLPVSVADPLPPTHNGELAVPPVLSRRDLPAGLSRTAAATVACLWTAGLGVIGFTWWKQTRRRRIGVPAAIPEDELARKLRLAERKMLTPQGMAEVERLLLGRWLRELDIREIRLVEGIRELEKHPRGRDLLAAFEDWQRRLESGPSELPTLLRTYIEVPVSPAAEGSP